MQTDYPSWLYQITKGATTIWEHWDGLKTDGSFWSADMNSFNHYAYGAIGEWMYKVVAGINIDETAPAYKNIIFKPLPGGELTSAQASIDSMYGKVSISWKLENQNISIDVEIPCNTTAELTLPSANLEQLIKSTVISSEAQATQSSDGVTVKLGSGKYSFSYCMSV